MLRILSIFARLHKVIHVLYATGVIDILSKGSSCSHPVTLFTVYYMFIYENIKRQCNSY